MIQLAVIGCGYWGPNLVRNFFSLPGVRVRYVCDLDSRRLKTIQDGFPTVKTTTAIDEVIADTDVEAVVIATPVHTHYALGKQALLSGKHVLVEKPMAASLREAKELSAIAGKRKRILMVDHTFVYSAAVQKIKEIVDRNELGKLCYFDSVRVNLGLFQQRTNVLWDLATHDISIMDYIIGKKPVAVSAVGSSHIKKGLENIVYVTVKFEDNLIGHIHVNWLAPVKLRMTLISGLKKMIVYNDMEPIEKIKVYDRAITLEENAQDINISRFQYRVGDMYSPRLDDIEALHFMSKHFIQCIRKQQQPLTDGKAGLRVIQILDAAEKSLKRNGKFIPLATHV